VGTDQNQEPPSTVVCGLLKTVEISFLFTLSDTIVLWRRKFGQKPRCFFKMWNDNEVPKQTEARELEQDRSYNQMQ